MKIHHKKLLISGTALAVAGILGIGALMQTSVSVQASAAMMPGIETIVNETSKEEPFRILEIVDYQKEAEIGYYISGQEPYYKLYKFPKSLEQDYLDDSGRTTVYDNITSVEDILSRLQTAEQRQDFMQNTKYNEENPEEDLSGVSDSDMTDRTGIKNIRSICGPDSDGPLTYIPYNETYFPNEDQMANWQQVSLAKIRTVQIAGTYEKAESGVGDYNRNDLNYYPIREGTEDSAKPSAKYRENIESFSYGMEGENQPYEVKFSEVPNASVSDAAIKEYYENGLGLYTNVYGYLSDSITDIDFANFPGEDINNTFWDNVDNLNEEVQLQSEESQFESEQLFSDSSSFASEDSTENDLFSDSKSEADMTNPNIYRDEEIDYFPFHKYYKVGTYSEVKNKIDEQSSEIIFEDDNMFDSGESGDFLEGNNSFYKDIEGNYYWKNPDGTKPDQRLVYVIGKERQPYSNTQALTVEDYTADLDILPYYYFVEKYGLACKLPEGGNKDVPDDYQYTGWYYAINPVNEERFVEAGENEIAHFYASDEEFVLNPGKGEFDFKPNENEGLKEVQVNSFYYSGGYMNQDWFKKYVFNLYSDSEDEAVRKQFDDFAMEVDTITAAEFESKYGAVNPNVEETQVWEDKAEVVIENESEFQDDSHFPEVQSPDDINSDDGWGENQEADNTYNVDISDGGQESSVEPLVSETQDSIENFGTVEGESVNQSEIWTDGESASSLLSSDEISSDFSALEDPQEQFASSEQSDFISDGLTIANELTKYSLVYVNGKLSEEAAQVLAQGAASKSYACIINQDKTFDSDGISNAFSLYLKADDLDQTYVNQNVYFFNNPEKDTDGNKMPSALVNLNFHSNFNIEGSESMEGFEEILDYINNENQYRQLHISTESSTDDLNNEFSDGVKSTELLSTDISQARVVEYIINYKYKRSETKDGINNVLQIEPAKTDNPLSPTMVRKWLNESDSTVGFTNATVCCTQTASNSNAKYLIDGDTNNRWVNKWQEDHTHWFQVEISGDPTLLSGVIFTPRQDNYIVGYPLSYRIEISKEKDGEPMAIYDGEFQPSGDYKSSKQVIFDRVPSEAKFIKFEYINSEIDKEGNVKASCAEFSPLSNMNIDTMTSSEYVGHIDDINSKYDLIYIGDDGKNRNKFINGDDPNMLYTHVGGTILAYQNGVNKLKYLGLMDNEYEAAEGTYTATIKGVQEKINYLKRFKTINNYSLDGIGSFKGSGNDITNQQYHELMDFVKSGYPVVLGESLVNIQGNSREVNSQCVDKSSYFYQFMKEALGYQNVVSEAELSNGSRSIEFYSNLPKPHIIFDKENGKPLDPPTDGNTEDIQKGIGYVDGSLEYKFSIVDEAAVSPATTTYDCKLYLDLNFDGNLSALEEQQKYIEIRDRNGQVVPLVNYGENDARYQLKAKEEYTLIRKLPSDYFKIITWKLEVSSNINTYIRTSEIGYAKQEGDSLHKQEIKVLQITPTNGVKGNKPGTWNLEADLENKNSTFSRLMNKVLDFDIKVKSVTIKQYEAQPSLLDDKQMLIIGFDDTYANISNTDGQVDKILDFIKSGKSVIFSHDTTSYINWDYKQVYNKVARTEYGKDEVDLLDSYWLWNTSGNPQWGLSLNSILRSIVGMDRYGIVTGTSQDTLSNRGSMTVSDLLKRGLRLTDGQKIEYDGTTETVSFERLLKIAGDVAYVSGDESRSQSYSQTQGYSNIQLENVDFGSATTTVATKVNEGAITQYPFKMKDSITVADTHAQDLQLAMERDRDINGVSDGKNDIVVWYCLDKGKLNNKEWYGSSPNDVRNYYYFYSKGNVIYTGAGHSLVSDEDEIKLFINAIVAAANVTAVQPEVDFVKSLNPAAEKESVRYYMTDQTLWLKEDTNVLEKDMEFYFNVKDYNMVSSSLSAEDQKNQNMTVEFFIEDSASEPQDTAPEYLKEVGMKSINNKIGQLVQYGNDSFITQKDSDGRFVLNRNNAYGFSIENIENYLRSGNGNDISGGYRTSSRLFIKVTSTVTLYGVENVKTSWSVLDLKQRQLFDLD